MFESESISTFHDFDDSIDNVHLKNMSQIKA
jgi:hypothetical protein